MSERQGIYIVIEGADGTGKSEQVKLIARRMQTLGEKVLLLVNDDTGELEPIQEPGGVPFSNEIRKIIINGSLERRPWDNVELFTLARSANWYQAMEPALDKGIHVPTARSWISTVTYQGYGQGISIEKIRERTLEAVSERYMHPDLEIILTLQDEVVRKSLIDQRGELKNPDTFESMPESFQSNMKDGYIRYALENDIKIIPVYAEPNMSPAERMASIYSVNDQIWAKVEPLIS